MEHYGIEAVHRGFLHQHLYGVGCILLARDTHGYLADRSRARRGYRSATEQRYVQLKYAGALFSYQTFLLRSIGLLCYARSTNKGDEGVHCDSSSSAIKSRPTP